MAPSDPVTRADAAHLLRRVGFGGTESEITSLTGRTREECAETMRDRINGMRQRFVSSMKAQGVDRDFSFINQQRGMFSFSGLTKAQVQQLREKYSIYIVGSGRINVAGMTEQNMDRLCTAIASVL